MPNRIVKGDTVIVTSGKEKGRQGLVIKVIPKKEKLVIQGLNMVKRHTKADQKNPQGGIIEKEAPIHLSNVMLIDPQDGRPTRVGFEKKESGWKRFSRRTKAEIPFPKN